MQPHLLQNIARTEANRNISDGLSIALNLLEEKLAKS